MNTLATIALADLDYYEEKTCRARMAQGMSQEDALQLIINDTEGDYSQLSPALAAIAYHQEVSDITDWPDVPLCEVMRGTKK